MAGARSGSPCRADRGPIAVARRRDGLDGETLVPRVPESTGYHRRAMPDQLSLRLEAELPRPPATLRPMLARPLPEPFDSPDHLFEPAWGGRRALVVIEPGETAGGGAIALIGEDGSPILPVPPDLLGLAVRVAARSAVLDVEIVVVDAHGHLDADGLARRLRGEPGPPLAVLAFDLLHVDGRSLLSRPLVQRRETLRRILHPGDEVVAVPAIPGEGRALFEAVRAQGLAGVRARQAASPYLPGVRSRLWRFVSATSPLHAGPGSVGTGAGGAGGATDRRADADLDVDGGERAGRVLAVFRRLPLDLDDRPPSDRPPSDRSG